MKFYAEIGRALLYLSSALVKPHQAGAAYSRRDTVVALATSCSAVAGRPWDFRTRRAYREREQTPNIPSMCVDVPRSSRIVTPRIFMVATRSTPAMVGGSSVLLRRRINISRDLDAFRRKLLRHRAAHVAMWSSSIETVALFEAPTIK